MKYYSEFEQVAKLKKGIYFFNNNNMHLNIFIKGGPVIFTQLSPESPNDTFSKLSSFFGISVGDENDPPTLLLIDAKPDIKKYLFNKTFNKQEILNFLDDF